MRDFCTLWAQATALERTVSLFIFQCYAWLILHFIHCLFTSLLLGTVNKREVVTRASLLFRDLLFPGGWRLRKKSQLHCAPKSCWMIQMERKTHVRRNRGLKDECWGQQTRNIDPRQQHILRMLHPVTAATLQFIPLCHGSVEDKCCSWYWGCPWAPTGLAPIACGWRSSRKMLLSYLEAADPAPSSWGGEFTPSSWSRAASSGGQTGQEEGTGSPAAEAGRQSLGPPVRKQSM